jgi:hypothetical protein
VKALVEAGACVHHITNNGSTARDVARTNGHLYLLRLLRSPVARTRWRRAILLVRAVVAFLAAGRTSVLRNADTFFSAASGGILTEVPNVCICPITMELLQDPVVTSDGLTYERWAIERHFQTNGTRSPKTNLPLAHDILITNANLRIHIQDTISRGREIHAAQKRKRADVQNSKHEPKRQRRL